MPAHVAAAIIKVENFHIKPTEDLDQDLQKILALIQEKSGSKIGDVYTAYIESSGEMSYKSFQRRIAKLDEGRFITTEKVSGKDGNTTIIHFSSHKKLTEF